MKRLHLRDIGFKQKVLCLFLSLVMLAGIGLLPASNSDGGSSRYHC